MAKQIATTTKANKLTDKQRMFIEQYFICGLNGTEAAMLTYDCKDRAVARALASENLAKPAIRARVDERLAEVGMSAQEVLARIAQHARGTLDDFIDEGSGTIDMKAAKKAKSLHLVKRFKTKFITGEDSEVLETEIELYDAQAALRDLGKHYGLFGSDASVNINVTNMTDEQLEALANGKKVIDVEAIK